MATTIDIGTLIVTTSGVCGGRPRIEGSRITVRQVMSLLREGLSPEEVADEYSSLTLAQIYAAITYFHANQQQMEGDFAADAEEEERLEKEWLARSHRS